MSLGVSRFLVLPGCRGQNLHGFWFSHYSNIGGAGKGPAGTAGNDEHRVNAGVCWACACDDVVAPGVIY